MTIDDLEVIHVSTKKLIKLPEKICRDLEIEDGDKLLIVEKDKQIILKKITDADLKGIEKNLVG